jgi:xanthine dehydrogenase YagR molybdenum-binding subunit
VKAGDVVVMPIAYSDSTCEFCREGLPTACVHLGFFGNPGYDGAQAEAMRIPYAETGLPYSSRNLVACFREGARRFGWEGRDPTPRARQEGRWLVGTGVASSTYPVFRLPGSVARIRYEGEGHYAVEIGAADIGTGTWTALTQISADALGVGDIDLRIGDTTLPRASVAGGSSGINTWGSTIFEAARDFRERHGEDPSEGDTAEAGTPHNPEIENYAIHAFGAYFVEARVNEDTGEVRVPRMTGTFAVGNIINPKTARSQFIGGMTMGLGMALHEESMVDGRFRHVVNHDFAEYHIPTNADVGEIDVSWVEEDDPHVNPMGAKGIGEIGIVGSPAAVANAVYHATGIRVRDLPITPDKLQWEASYRHDPPLRPNLVDRLPSITRPPGDKAPKRLASSSCGPAAQQATMLHSSRVISGAGF